MPVPEQPTKIRVAHIITRLIVGGAQENTLYTAAGLDANRYQVQVICGPQTGSEGSLIEEARRQQIALTILPDLLRQVSLLHDLKALIQLVRLFRREKYDIVHTHSSKAGILGRLAARLAGTPHIVHTVHGWSFHEYMPPLTRRVYILLERWMAGFSDALIVVAEKDRYKGLQAGIGRPQQYRLIRSAIPLDDFDPERVDRQVMRRELGIPPQALVVGNVGRFSAQKNPLEWVKVAGIIARLRPQVNFLLVGDGPLRSQVEAQIHAEGIAARTLLTGLRRDVPQLMAAMDVFLLTSLWEGLPRVLPQAMAMRLPVVAQRADGTAEVVRDGVNGYLFEPGESEKMAQACIALLDNPALRHEMGLQGQKIAGEKFNLRAMIQDIETLYAQLLNEQPGAAHPPRSRRF